MNSLPIIHEPYQCFVMACPAYQPFSFAIHTWIVTVHNGVEHRYEVLHQQHNGSYTYCDQYPSCSGIEKNSRTTDCWSAKVLGYVAGNETSVAAKMVHFIESTINTYEHRSRYVLYPGPNSNTYTQWVLNHFPDCEIKLPWNAFGKNYQK